MSNLVLAAGGDDAYTISRSVRLRSSASAYLNRTFSAEPSTYTLSVWCKRGVLGAYETIAASRNAAVHASFLAFNNSDQLYCYLNDVSIFTTTAVFRDPSAWYHIVLKVTQSGAVVCYVNNQQVGSGTVGSSSYLFTNASGYVNAIGRYGDSSSNYFDGYLADVYFIDGQALTPSSFGETDAITGVWKPKKYTGTYGNNGFYLNFSSNSIASALGTDFSGRSNNWTVNNISVIPNATYDSMTDVPTLTSDTAANYAVLNPLDNGGIAISNGNLTATYSPASWIGVRGSIAVPKTGKWKWEVTASTMNYGFIGLAMASAPINSNGYSVSNVYSWYLESGEIRYSNTNQVVVSAAVAGDVCEIRVDNGTVSFYKNNVLMYTFTQPMNTISADYFPASWLQSGAVHNYNFGQRPFTYTVSGYNGLNTFNLPDSTIKAGNKYFDVSLWTGNSVSPRSISNAATFQPDFVWIKNRSAAGASWHELFDSVRGAGSTKELSSNSTNAEGGGNAALYGYLSSFNSNGFTLTTGSSNMNQVNGSDTYVGWQWQAGGAAVSNNNGTAKSASVTVDSTTDKITWTSHGMSDGQKIGFFASSMPGGLSAGTLYYVVSATTNDFKVALTAGGTAIDITSNGTTVTCHTTLSSSVSANTTAGFSIVTYTGTGANATVEHGLGVAPKFVIVKNRSAGSTNWCVYHSFLTSAAYSLFLDNTNAQGSFPTVWNSTAPTSTVLSLGTNLSSNGSTNSMVAYCFSEVAGFSKFGSYTGNGSADGPFVYCGFRPRYIMMKRSDSVSNWTTYDTARDTYNAAQTIISPNTSSAEYNGSDVQIDVLSNGFKLRTTNADRNPSGGTMIFAAFAENPFKNSLAR